MSEFVMNTSNESTSKPTDTATVDHPMQSPTERLRLILSDPKPKDADWQAQAGNDVSRLAVGFLNDPSDESALRTVALLGLAQSLGVKEARKRIIRLSRWTEIAPPPLTSLAMPDEQQAALTALAKINTMWSRRYAEQALADLAVSDEFVFELLKWAWASYPDNLSFTQDFYAPQIVAAKSAGRTAALLKDAVKLLKPSKPVAAVDLAVGMASLVDAFLQSFQPDVVDEKVFWNNAATLLSLMQDQAAAVPAVLLQPIYVRAVGRLAAIKSKGAVSKHVVPVVDALSLATISLLATDVERFGYQAAERWRAMVPTWRAAYPGWDASFALATAALPSLAALDAGGNEAVQDGSDSRAAEAVFARLLPAWDAFVAELPEADRAASLGAMLYQAAATANVAPLGEKGAVVSFDPLSHHLVDDGGEPCGQARIVRPGVQVQRPDGSTRVLVAALVVAV